MDRMRVGILIFDDVEVLDYCGPFEVFSVSRWDEATRLQEKSPFEVLLVAETLDPVTTSGGMRVLPDVDFGNCPELELLLVPGGVGARRELKNEVLLAFLRERGPKARLLASVCTGSLLLAQAGLLEGHRATTHWASLALLRELFPAVKVDERAHVVEEGNLFTSAGIAAGIDLALRIVARCCGEAVARAAAFRMEYPYPEGNGRRVRLEPPGPWRVDFEALPWTSPMEGVRCKIHAEGDRRLRLVEYAAAMPPHWCEKGHHGLILAGEFEIEFEGGRTLLFRAGDGVFIPDGPEHRHRACSRTETVTALFVESM